MGNKYCSICFHPESKKINQALANSVGHKVIAATFEVSRSSIGRHSQDCIRRTPNKMDVMKRADANFNYLAELLKRYRKNEKYADAYEQWLSDPEDPTKFFVGPRSSEMMIVYDDWNELNERGNPTRKKAILNDLLKIISGTKREIIAVNSFAVDNRKMYLECFKSIRESLQDIGRHLGLWKQDAKKDDSAELEHLRMVIQSSADEHGTTYEEEARILFALPVAETIRADIKAQIISDLEQ